MHRVRLMALVSVCALAVGASVLTSGAAADDSSEKGPRASCEQFRLGSTYITSLKQKNTKCGNAKKVATKYTDCRKDNGGANGTCNETVAHYSCDEGKREGNKFQFNAKVHCNKGGNKVNFSYTQQK